MNWQDLATYYIRNNPDLDSAWRESYYDRELLGREGPTWDRVLEERIVDRDTDPQQVANADHYIQMLRRGQKSPLHGIVGMGLPTLYSLGKRTGLLGGRSRPDYGQWSAGTQGALTGLLGSGAPRMVPGLGAAWDIIMRQTQQL